MSDKVRLHVKGLTYSERPTGAYALLLESEGDKRKLPIVIGAFEAQSIAIALDKMTRPPRPMTHDLFASVMESHHIKLTEVLIRDLQDGVFYAVLVFAKGDDVRMTDARPSDAIALALRADCPIYAAKVAAANPDESPEEVAMDSEESALETAETQRALSQASPETLEDLLHRALEHEDYELAARIRDELNKR
jgi:uncharacterized protein